MQVFLRRAMILMVVFVALSSRAESLTDPVCTTVDEPIDLRPWTEESYSAVAGFPAGQWLVNTDGSSTFQIYNGQPTLFVSDFQTGRLVIVGRMRVEPGWDDDFIGFMLGYLPGDNTNASADYLLVDWKKGTQFYDFSSPSDTPGGIAKSGLAVSRVRGIPSADEFWSHMDFDHPASPPGQGVQELARAHTLGETGWQYSRDYAFRFEFGEVGLRVFVDGKLELEVSGDFSGLANRRFTFYNFSQESVRYSGFTRRKLCAPVAYDQSVSTPQETPVSITLTAKDPEGDPLSYSIVTPPAFGTLSVSGAHVVYTPKPGFAGNDSFTFRARDTTANSNTATVSISVSPVSTACSTDSARWLPAGMLSKLHLEHTSTVLSTGQVLVTSSYSAIAELYNPSSGSGTWAPATNSASAIHRNHTATELRDHRVLVAGGEGTEPGWFAELYDPGTSLWTPASRMTAARRYHTATLLPDGTVLVTGGSDPATGIVQASAELYFPEDNLWVPVGNMAAARRYHTATLLPGGSGKVLVTGGSDGSGTFLSSAEIYDLSTQTWTATGSMTSARSQHTTTLLPNGLVLATGGGNTFARSSTAELYDPVTKAWKATGDMISARSQHTTTLLPDGRVLAVGGYNPYDGRLASAELFNFRSGSWCPASRMAASRYGHAATLLPGGQVLVTAGFSDSVNQYTAELYVP